MSKLQNLFVALVLNKHNIQMMHWNNVGLDFDPTHEKLAQYIDEIDSYIDEVAEILRMVGERPLSLPGCIAFAEKSDLSFLVLDEKDYVTNDVWKNCMLIFEQMGLIYASITDEDFPRDIVNKLEEEQYWFRKENQFKNHSRLRSAGAPEASTVTPDHNKEPESIVPDTVPNPDDAPVESNDTEHNVPLHDGDEDYSDSDDDYDDYEAPIDDMY